MLYASAQTLTDPQKAQARTNIGVLPAATNAQVVALSSNAVAVTPASLVNAGVINWLFDTLIDAGDADGTGNRVNLKFVNGGIRAEAPEGTSFIGFSGTGQGIVFAGDGSTWLSLNAGNSPGFQVDGAMQWGSYAEAGAGAIVGSTGVRHRSQYVHLHMGADNFAAEEIATGDFTSQNVYGWVQGQNSGLYVGQLQLAGASAGMSFQNGGAGVPINTDGGALVFTHVDVSAALDILGYAAVNFDFDSYANFLNGSYAYFDSGSNLVFGEGSYANFSGASPPGGSRTTLPAAATDLASAIALVNALRLLVGPDGGNGFGFADL